MILTAYISCISPLLSTALRTSVLSSRHPSNSIKNRFHLSYAIYYTFLAKGKEASFMKIDTNTVVSMADANQNFSKVAHIADQYGRAVIFRTMILATWSSNSRLPTRSKPHPRRMFLTHPAKSWICMMMLSRSLPSDLSHQGTNSASA